jgi:hypothetical protein
MRKWELVVIWSGSTDKAIFTYDSQEEAEKAGDDFKFAFGNKIEWYGVRPKNWV